MISSRDHPVDSAARLNLAAIFVPLIFYNPVLVARFSGTSACVSESIMRDKGRCDTKKNSILPCIAKRQYLLTLQVSRYCLLTMQSSVGVCIIKEFRRTIFLGIIDRVISKYSIYLYVALWQWLIQRPGGLRPSLQNWIVSTSIQIAKISVFNTQLRMSIFHGIPLDM